MSLVSAEATLTASTAPGSRERQAMLHLSNASHAVNHFQNQMMTMLYPHIMAELGLTYTLVGILSAICSVLSSVCQGAYVVGIFVLSFMREERTAALIPA